MTTEFGYSPCPNDTFMFWAWVHNKLDTDLSITPRLYDIQELNQRALANQEFSLTKVSMATYLKPQVNENYQLLSSGAALGRGCGPLIVSKTTWDQERPLRLAIPGRDTTACRLAEMAVGARVSEWVELRYDEIMPAVLAGEKVDAGVIIHESRFVYRDLGLELAFDLGEWWETETGLPLPLGLMVARNDVDEKARVEEALKDSISLAWRSLEDESLWRYLRDNAIELDDTTMKSHIDLYVNNFSLDLGEEGRATIEEFQRRAK